MFAWFRAIFQGRPAQPEAGLRPVQIPDAPSKIIHQDPPEDDPFEAVWARLSGHEVPVPAPLPENIKVLADSVRAHFERNKPAPSSFPTLAVRVMDLLAQPEVDVHELLKTIGPDPAISAQLMKVANSAHYHRGQDVLDLRTAVMKIGLRDVGKIAAGVAGRSIFDVSLRVEYETFPDRWRALFLSTMTTAFSASQFSFEQHHSRPDWIFLGGMFMDIGKTMALRSLAQLIIAGHVPQQLEPGDVDALLEEVHLEIGAEALRVWGLPSYLREICLHHHDAQVETREYAAELHALRLTDGVSRLVQDSEDGLYLDQTRQSMEALHLDRVRLRMLHKVVVEQKPRVAALFPN